LAFLAVGTLYAGDVAGLVLDAVQRARARAGTEALERRPRLDAIALEAAQTIADAPHAERLVVGEATETRLRAGGIDGFGRVTEHVALERGDADPATRLVSSWYGYKSSWKEATSGDYDAIGLATVVAADGVRVLVAILVQDQVVPYVAGGAARPGNEPEIDLRALERDLVAAVNGVRRNKGLSVLTFDEELAAVARDHSEDMSQRDYFSHFSPEGLSPRDRVEKNGVAFRRMGENLQMSRGDRDPVKGAVDSWMRSRGHRKTMLTPEFRLTGVGAARGTDGAFYFTQLFMLPADASGDPGRRAGP
jgi:uncharacterized protein YkwD